MQAPCGRASLAQQYHDVWNRPKGCLVTKKEELGIGNREWGIEMENRKLSFYKFILARALLFAYVSSKTHNLQRVFRLGGGWGGLFGYIGMCHPKGYGCF